LGLRVPSVKIAIQGLGSQGLQFGIYELEFGVRGFRGEDLAGIYNQRRNGSEEREPAPAQRVAPLQV